MDCLRGPKCDGRNQCLISVSSCRSLCTSILVTRRCQNLSSNLP